MATVVKQTKIGTFINAVNVFLPKGYKLYTHNMGFKKEVILVKDREIVFVVDETEVENNFAEATYKIGYRIGEREGHYRKPLSRNIVFTSGE